MISGLDHMVILVRDLERAARDYGRLGFRVTPGGEHADGLTHNALIPFHDGTYLEIVAFLDPDDPRDNVWGWRRFVATGGLVDHCLASADLAADARRLREAGFRVAGPTDGGRRSPGGEEIRWRSASVAQEGKTLPFLIEDVTPRARRVPAGRDADHPNGAAGISALEIVASEETARSYATLVDAPEVEEGEGVALQPGVCAVSFTPLAGTLGPGPRAMKLAARTGDARELDPDMAHGARIQLG